MDAFLINYVQSNGKYWADLARLLGGREHNQTADAVRNRFIRLTHGTRKQRGPSADVRIGWTKIEDEVLLRHVVTHGTSDSTNDWVSASVLLGRSPRSCRRRYERLCE